ncbi:MAG: DUF4956 domain-containing protein [Bacteroidales bacterium]|jgi:hypothetical protein|nr:DUF4956 domain-containing protein [Bacteroidales bacterium]
MILESLVNEVTLQSILLRFTVNLFVIFILIRVIYYRFTGKAEYLFSYFLLGIVIFFLCSILETVEIQLGMALGLFAIFAILRFRTINYTAKDMTYIFLVIGLSLINSQAKIPPPVIGAAVINSIILVAAFILELFLKNNSLASFVISYDKFDLLNPARESELLQDLSGRTGKKIEKVKIRKMDLIKNSSEIEVFFKE